MTLSSTIYLQKGKTPTTRVLDVTLNHLMLRVQSWRLGNVEYMIILITPRSLRSGVVVPDRVSSICQIEIFNHLLYL